jgi:hypothetical protein
VQGVYSVEGWIVSIPWGQTVNPVKAKNGSQQDDGQQQQTTTMSVSIHAVESPFDDDCTDLGRTKKSLPNTR